MRLRADLLVFLALLAGSVYAVWTQVGADPLAPYAAKDAPPPIGSRLEEFALVGIGGTESRLSQLRGAKATVLYFWSIDCPCVEAVEMRVKEAMRAFAPRGVSFVAIDGHPDDARDGVVEKMVRIKADYTMLLDPKQEVVRKAGARTSTEVVVLDAQDRIRYRGSIDDDLVRPTQGYLVPALEAVLAGKSPVPAETRPYGCPFPGFDGQCAFQ